MARQPRVTLGDHYYTLNPRVWVNREIFKALDCAGYVEAVVVKCRADHRYDCVHLDSGLEFGPVNGHALRYTSYPLRDLNPSVRRALVKLRATGLPVTLGNVNSGLALVRRGLAKRTDRHRGFELTERGARLDLFAVC